MINDSRTTSTGGDRDRAARATNAPQYAPDERPAPRLFFGDDPAAQRRMRGL